MAQRTTPPDLPGFTFIEWLGGGGFADVFRYQDSLGRVVAVKVQHRGVFEGDSRQFEAEANLMAKLSNHPNIVSVFQAGLAADGRPFLVMEECSTAHLGARIARRTMTPSKAMEITVQIAGAVETAHRLGILHRDIKPANILFTEFQRPALTDFGISASGGAEITSNALSPQWAPWEQYPDSGLSMGPWSDVFSLAATMWAMLVGRSPLVVPGGDNDRLAIRRRIRDFSPSRTGRQDVPELLERVLLTALAIDPAQRYQSSLEFARAIQGVQGQLNEPVTPIDVLSDQPDYEEDEPELAETGTRVSGFQLIDPERSPDMGNTASITGPTGGVTSPLQDVSSRQDSSPASGAGTSPLIQHGRGMANPGIRDFTGPVVPSPSTQQQVSYQGSVQAGEPAPESRLRKTVGGVVFGAVAILVAIGVLVGLWWSGALGLAPATQTTEAPGPSRSAADPLALRVPPVEDGAGKREGDVVTFTWTNPDPKPADKYLVEEVSRATAAPQQIVADPTIAVPAQAGRTCVEVRLRRGNGQASASTRICVES